MLEGAVAAAATAAAACELPLGSTLTLAVLKGGFETEFGLSLVWIPPDREM